MKDNFVFKFSKYDIENWAENINFNVATSFKHTLGFCKSDSDDSDYIIMDFYCKDPKCDCTVLTISFIERKDGELDLVNPPTIDYDYKKRKVRDIENVLPIGLDTDLISDDELNLEFEKRHKSIKKSFKQWLDVHSNYKMKTKIGRNDVCFCGSGKKFKKCCEQ